ncbi:Eco29kI family restriction endonuclease [Nonomuraea zeae]|uniref:Eco29kI family restriction endonuclease n=1 Tax=Nonomuraea zeae TaxID=1642303 RepID=A0A5S4H2A7_9ACTN|nr:Eco29kI family restriction endonuclease [Nonomuraea zeae]TMR38841.1 Eco29kI family restriction endonuclease [Nonomuraea zeae]
MGNAFGGYEPYNPLDEKNLAQSVADALERERVHLLPPAPFTGPGLYALYYVGDFELYASLGEMCRRNARPGNLDVGPEAVPIYVGKAAASGSRHGNLKNAKDKTLSDRIRKHMRSIEAAASTLRVRDFRVRYLRVKDIWIPLGEYGLLQRYAPIWNRVLDGFGNNDPGRGRADQARSPWDTLHPGRVWAERLPVNLDPPEHFEAKVRQAVQATVRHQPLPETALSDQPALDLSDLIDS